LTRYLDEGRIEIDNNAAERALHGVSLGRKNYLFMGSEAGGERAAAIYSLVETAKLNGLDPEGYVPPSRGPWGHAYIRYQRSYGGSKLKRSKSKGTSAHARSRLRCGMTIVSGQSSHP